jgi:hypothetical protein
MATVSVDDICAQPGARSVSNLGMTDAVDAACRRDKPRRRVLLSGKIVLGNGLSPDCTIRNLTDSGAQIRVATGQAIPDAFHLIEIRSGMAYRAEVAWRTPSAAGLKFSESIDLSQSSAAVPVHLRTLWLGCAQRGVGDFQS